MKIDRKIDAKSIEVGRSGSVEAPKSVEAGRSRPVEAPKSIEVGRSSPGRSSWHRRCQLEQARVNEGR
jgi:hypothetical protein